MFSCPICQQDTNESPCLPCQHKFCKDCLSMYLKVRIAENNVMTMPCPQTSCPYIMKENEIEALVPAEFYLKYKLFYRNSNLSQNPNLRFCPKVDCQGYDIGSSKKRKLKCYECFSEFCYYCNEPWHYSSSCTSAHEINFDLWSTNNNVKTCPNCKRRVEKAGGCPSMECPVCKHKWCWYCGIDLENGHDPIFCIFSQDSWQLRYWFTVFLLFGPITVPFGIGLFLIHLGQNYLTDTDKESKLVAKLMKWRYISYPIIVVFSPVLTVFMMLASGFFIIYINKTAFKPYRTGCYSRTFNSRISRCLLMSIIGCITSIIISSLFTLVWLLTPVIGFIFLVRKICADLGKGKTTIVNKSKGYIEI